MRIFFGHRIIDIRLPGQQLTQERNLFIILLRDKRGEVATFSFLMVILPILGEGLLDTVKLLGSPASEAGAQMGLMPILIGFAAAFLSGCAACSWMINLVKKGKLLWFAIYCAVMGVICILW